MPMSAFLHPFARPTASDFLCLVRGEGALVYDDRGREYVDAMASLWFCDVGHGRAEIADAVADQLRTLAAFHAFDRFTNEPAEALAAALVERAPMPGARVFLTSSGSEAVDTALKLVRAARTLGGEGHRRVVVSLEGAYHGVTYGGLAVGGLPLNQEHFGPMVPDVVQVPRNDARGRGAGAAGARRRGRRSARGAGAGRRRGAPARRGLPRRGAPAVRRGRGLAGPRRGDLRVRPARPAVGGPALRRAARPGHVRQGGHLRVRAAGRGARRRPRSASGWRPTRPTCCGTGTPTAATPRPASPRWPTCRLLDASGCSSGSRRWAAGSATGCGRCRRRPGGAGPRRGRGVGGRAATRRGRGRGARRDGR